jgi:hypothetical protein
MMKYRLLTSGLILSACMAGLMGCQESVRRRPYPPDKSYTVASRTPRFEIIGVAGESARGQFAFGNFDKTRIEGAPIRIPIRPYEKIQTDGIVKIEVSQVVQENGQNKHYYYKVLLVADPASRKPAEGWVQNSAPSFFISQGWLFIWGRMPFIETDWVSAGTVGCTLAVQIDEDENVHRIFYLRESKADGELRLNCPPDTLACKVQDICQYVEVKPGCVVETLCVKDAPREVRESLEEIKKIAESAGWNEKGTINCLEDACP